MTRIKIKESNNKDPRQKNTLLEILSKNDICYKTHLPCRWRSWLTNDHDQDKLFNSTISKELKDKGLVPAIPPKLKANRSVIVFDVDNLIYHNEEEEIMNEIIDKKEWANREVDSLF